MKAVITGDIINSRKGFGIMDGDLKDILGYGKRT
jgi:hypothetical protein